MKHRRKAAFALLSICALVIGPSVTQALAQETGGEPPKPAGDEKVAFGSLPAKYRVRMQAQDKARTAASQIRWAVERSGAAGFTGLELSQGGVRLWYQGTLPLAVSSAVAKARSTAPVEVRAAKYSLAQLTAASDRMVAYLKQHPGGPGHQVSIPVDGSGLEVGVDSLAASAKTAVPDVGVPSRVVVKERIKAAGRFNDVAPYWGGARIISDYGAQCTAGFGVITGGQEYLLTAGHCGRPGNVWRTGDWARVIGTATHEDVGNDLLMVTAQAGNRIFTGAGDSTVSMNVAWWDWAYTGEELCSSGATSKVICGHVITDAGNTSYCGYDAYGNWECYGGLVRSEQEDGWTAGQGGDSGGPVFLPMQSGAVVAKGIISGSGGDVLVWQDFATAWQLWGVVPVTS